MDTQFLLNGVFVVAVGVGGWFAREVWSALKEFRRDIKTIEVNLPKEYVLRSDLDKRMDHIESMFQRIYDKLDQKQDR